MSDTRSVGPGGDYSHVNNTNYKVALEPPLRRPLKETVESVKQNEKPCEPRQPAMREWNLDAKEFIPISIQSLPYSQAVTSTVITSNLNANVAPFVPANMPPTEFGDVSTYEIDDCTQYLQFQRLSLDRPDHLELSPLPNYDTEYENITEQADESFINFFKEFLFQVTTRPNFFDDVIVVDYIQKEFTMPLTHYPTCQQIINLIIEQAISEQNFRYSGARMCQCFTQTPTDFRKHFLASLRAELHNSNSTSVRQCGFLLFLAELFVHLKTDKHEPFIILRTAIYEMIDKLLKTPSVENIKCVCNVLKLTGAAINDTAAYTNRKYDFNTVYNYLAGFLNHPSSTISYLVDSVIKQQNNDWGRVSSSPATDSTQPVLSVDIPVQNEPVFYGENRETISRQQAGFDFEYDLSGVAFDNSVFYSQASIPSSDNEMDPEMEAAFEQFMKDQDKDPSL